MNNPKIEVYKMKKYTKWCICDSLLEIHIINVVLQTAMSENTFVNKKMFVKSMQELNIRLEQMKEDYRG